MQSRPPTESLCAKIIAAFLLTGTPLCLAQDNNNTNNSNASNSGNEVSALNTQIETLQKRQKEYQDRITEMESQMQALESKADSGSILNTRILTDADGKATEGAPPGFDEPLLTPNFTFSAYVRAGLQFNGNGGGSNFSFSVPKFPHRFVSISVYNGRRTVNRTVPSNG